MDAKFIFVFLLFSFICSVWSRNIAKGLIEKSAGYSYRYPSWYILPPKKIREIFKLQKRAIPKYLYFELIISLVFAILGPMNIIISLACISFEISNGIIRVLMVIQSGLVVLNIIFVLIMSLLMRNK